MRINNLNPAKGSIKKEKRIGRGQGSGHGGTSTRGHKGAGSRSGTHEKRNFEGGQMPLQMRLPKRGFKNIGRVEYIPIDLETLQDISRINGINVISSDVLYQLKYISRFDRIKILSNGLLTTSILVKAHAFSASARLMIESLGGNIEILPYNYFPSAH